MDACFDPTIPTELKTERNVQILIALISFWTVGAIYPIIFWPRSYVAIKQLERKRFPDSEKYKFDRHMYSDEVYAYIEKLAKFYNHKAKVYTLWPNTFQGRDIKVVHLSLPRYNHRIIKGTILVVGALHASIWDSVSATLDLIHKLLEECKYKVPYLLEYDWFIIPVVNPDGYDYSIQMRDIDLSKAVSPKNRAYYNVPENTQHCRGIYIERNFGFHWGESKKVDYTNFCWYSFAGLYPFSENETRAISNLVMSLEKRRTPITMSLQLHGSANRDQITYPWRFTTLETFNQPLLDAMAGTAAKEVNDLTGAYFTYMQGGKRDLGSGVLGDWLMGIMQVLYNFSIEPTFEVYNSTDVPDQQIYIEKARTIVFALVRQLRAVQSSAKRLSLNQYFLFTFPLFLHKFVVLNCSF